MPPDDIHTALAPVPAFTNKHPIHFSSTHAEGRLVEDREEDRRWWVAMSFCFVCLLVTVELLSTTFLPNMSLAGFLLVSLFSAAAACSGWMFI